MDGGHGMRRVRRPRRAAAERAAIVADAFAAGSSVLDAAGRHGVSTAAIYL